MRQTKDNSSGNSTTSRQTGWLKKWTLFDNCIYSQISKINIRGAADVPYQGE